MNKKEIAQKAKDILHKYPVNHSVSELADYEFLMNLFRQHPHYSIKAGSGIKDIVIYLTEFKNRCFYIIRDDGTSTDISYLVCINGAGTKKSDINRACRSAIHPVIVKYRNENVVSGTTVCPISGEILTYDNVHIDHYDLTFQELFNLWLKGKDINWLHSKLNITTADAEHQVFFTDMAIIVNFINFHNQHTHLRAVSKIANLSILRK